MHDSVGFELSLEEIRSTPPKDAVKKLHSWLIKQRPKCLTHPHGFYVVPLLISGSTDWRFHLWPASARSIAGMPAMIHTHNCNVDSHILIGELTNCIYSVAPDRQGAPLYATHYSGSRYSQSTTNSLAWTGERVLVTEWSSQTYKEGESYHVPRDTYHQARVQEGHLTATVVCMSDRDGGSAMVVGLDGYPEKIDFRREEIDPIIVAKALETP